jgi:hypothetical protein
MHLWKTFAQLKTQETTPETSLELTYFLSCGIKELGETNAMFWQLF